MSELITAIINIFRRGHILDEQISAIKNQSIPPKSIIIWNNGNKDINLSKYKEDPFFKVFDCNYNSGVWSRFIISLLAETEYICIFDDDTIPGNNWFKNCLNCMNEKEALYGTIGVIFKDSNLYDVYRRYGWDCVFNGNNTDPKPVDIVGHSWFFKKNWVSSYFLKEPPKVNEYFSVGEDINFSMMLQKYANIPTYVPPHPSNDISMFGSIPKTAWNYGCDGNSGSNVKGTFHQAYKDALDNGFRTLIRRQYASSISDLDFFLNKIRNQEYFALVRPADGEYQILQNHSLTNIDNWTFQKDGKISNDLNNALNIASNKNCYIGIPCGTCNFNMANWYINNYKLHPIYTTFANIFVNKNWKNWCKFLLEEKIPFVFIGPNNLPNNFFVQQYVNIPLYLVNNWDNLGYEYLTNVLSEIKKHKNKIFLFSAGPVSKIIISHAWNEHPYNTYLDIGSSLDIFMKGSSNREYTIEGSELSNLECNFDVNLIQI
jgi:hypothetical protein